MAMRLLAVAVVAIACGAAVVLPARSQPTAARTSSVSCDEIILNTKFPYVTGGYRLVLDAVSVPPSYVRQVVATQSEPWRYWSKAGMVIRAGAGPVAVTVPSRWRGRAAITWGNGGPPLSSVTFPRCEPALSVGHAYAGGFYLRARSGCVPLVVRIGQRSATVRFGLGRRCPESSGP
jgi:hypothetical protein